MSVLDRTVSKPDLHSRDMLSLFYPLMFHVNVSHLESHR